MTTADVLDRSVRPAGFDGSAFFSPTEAPNYPVPALTDVDADLIVVGSRGFHGVRALGSVSERVAHRADCSVLVVHSAAA